jgi:hypothetical protein
MLSQHTKYETGNLRPGSCPVKLKNELDGQREKCEVGEFIAMEKCKVGE